MGSSQPCGRTPGAPTSPRLPIAGRGCPLPWLPSPCVEWWVGGHRSPGSSLPVLLSSTVRGRSQDGPHHAQVRACWKEPQHPPVLQTQARTVPDQGCSSHPFLQKSGGPNCKSPSQGLPQATGFTRVSPGPPERWHLPTAAQSALPGGPPPKPNQSPQHPAGRWQLDAGLFCLPGPCQSQSARAGMTQSPGRRGLRCCLF